MKFKLDKATMRKVRFAKRKEKTMNLLREKGKEMTSEERLFHKRVMANDLTLNSTKAEIKLRREISKLGFVQNPVLLGFIPDFGNATKKIIVEVDGPIHRRNDVKFLDDRKRLAFESHGWTVLRFSNEDVMERLSAVLKAIHRAFGDL